MGSTANNSGLNFIPAPEMQDIIEQLYFDPNKAEIRLGNERMLLINGESFVDFRRSLIESLGFESARDLIMHFGYFSGTRDAKLAKKLRSGRPLVEQLQAGPHLHALTGFVRHPEAFTRELPNDLQQFEVEATWHESFEADAYISAFGVGSHSACWMETGYASGFLSTLIGRKVLVKEHKCRAKGDENCVAIAKTYENWPKEERESIDFASSRKPTKTIPKFPTINFPDSHEQEGVSPVGSSSPFSTIISRINRVAPTQATVLFLGESGVGKSLLAKNLHEKSSRKDQAFVEINCASIPEQLIESELFGVEKGAYTGASNTRPGRFEVANGGTIFLDEIGLLSLAAQSKLLRVLQTGEMEYLGSNKTRKVDVRVVAATNENLLKAVREGKFREDLFYRINVFPILIPPLRKRQDDLPDLIEIFLRRYSVLHNKPVKGLTNKAFNDLLQYSWPGNVRELENVIERAIILADPDEALDSYHLFAITDSDFEHDDEQPLKLLNTPSNLQNLQSSESASLDLDSVSDLLLREKVSIDDLEVRMIDLALESCKGNVTKAAEMLGMSRAKLDYRVKTKLAKSE